MSIEKIIEFAGNAPEADKNITDLDLSRGFPSRLQPARQWFNFLFNHLTKKINEIIDYKLDRRDLVGCVFAFTATQIPNRALVCDGKAYSRTDYAELFAKIGTTFGAGDGSTTFNVPDLRGQFIRGLDLGRGVDENRQLGSLQDDVFKSHNHNATTSNSGSHAHSASSSSAGLHSHTGTTNKDGSHAHSITVPTNSDGGTPSFENGGPATVTVNTNTDGSHSHGFTTGESGAHTHSITVQSSGSHSHTVTVDSTGSTETRPKNMALIYCIYY